MDKKNWISHLEWLVMFIAVLGAIFWSNNRMDGTIYAMNSRIDSLIYDLHHEMASLHKEMNDEMKDFHGRLCAIEERNKK